MSLNYEELKQKNAPPKATANDMIAKMEQASQVTIVESDYWKALINLNRNQNEKLEELTREVREHNNFARRMPVVEEQIKAINHRIINLEK